MWQGFKDFISRGNAIDLAVGVVVGAAFTQVISALTDDFLNPLIGAIFGKPDFSSLFQFQLQLLGEPAVVRPGVFLTALLNFLIVAAALYFFVVLPLNKLNETKDKALGIEKEEDEEEVSAEVALLTEIRDSLQTATSSGGKHKGSETNR